VPTTEERLRRVEAQLGTLLEDHRIGSALQGPFPVSDTSMRYRRVGSGIYYLPGTVAAVQDNTRNMAVTANRIYALPFLVVNRLRVNRLASYTQAGAAGNSRMGIYRDGADLVPHSLVSGSGSVAVGATANYHDFSPPVTLHRGLYWIALCFSATPTMFRLPYEQGVAWEILGRQIGISTAFSIGWIANHAFAPLQSIFPSTGLAKARDLPLMWIRLVP